MGKRARMEDSSPVAATAPAWLQRAGGIAWLVVGIGVVLAGTAWLLGQTSTIVAPLICGAVIGAVGGAPVGWLERHLPHLSIEGEEYFAKRDADLAAAAKVPAESA